MSRYHSIYATQQKKPTRWPLVLLIIVVVILSAATGAMIAQGETPRTLLDRADSNGSHSAASTPNPSLALAVDTPTETAAIASTPTATEESVANAAKTATPPVGAASIERPDSEGEPALAAATSPEASAVADTIELNDPSSPRNVVETFGARWAAGDYGGLYDLLTTTAKATITRQDFIDRYTGIQEEAGLTSVKFTVTGDPNLDATVPVKVEYTSSKVGNFEEENSVKLAKEGDSWNVEWTPSLIFNQLGDGSSISSRTP